LFLPVSDFLRGRLLEQGYPPERTVTHYLGIDVNEFSASGHVGRERVVLFVGRLSPEKGPAELLRSMVNVQQQAKDVKLVIIGDGPLRGVLEREACALRLNAEFLGSQPPVAVRAWMNRAMVLAAPSITLANGQAEGLGLAFVEAQAMGLPVAGFSTGGVPEAVADGETGLLNAEGDLDGLSHSLLALLERDERWTRLSAAGPRRVARLFNLATQTQRLQLLYDRVLTESGLRHCSLRRRSTTCAALLE
jgi:colanic acid/amylovoran biosynthesis glycosyltransferase